VSEAPLLQVSDLTTTFRTGRGLLTAVDGISFHINRGERVGLVGESGCGKSVTSRSIIRLVPIPPGRVEGSIRFEGQELLDKTESEMQRVRGEKISMIFQDPMTCLNPVYSIGEQVAETLRFHRSLSRAEAQAQAVTMLEQVGLPRAAKRLHSYPHELSGGMRQRVMIAIAIACHPALLIADEPTTALDVTIQAQIVELMRELNAEYGMSILFITHDLGVIAEMCDRVLVMYAGQIVESAPIYDLFDRPLHPYTLGLLACIPKLDESKERLQPIDGAPPDLVRRPPGCLFHPRCPYARERCRAERPMLRPAAPERLSACHFFEELLNGD
jgi:oligopeptide/dipeptide ABC transporter ATP-binding protein